MDDIHRTLTELQRNTRADSLEEAAQIIEASPMLPNWTLGQCREYFVKALRDHRDKIRALPLE